jgi:hypothetical protein
MRLSVVHHHTVFDLKHDMNGLPLFYCSNICLKDYTFGKTDRKSKKSTNLTVPVLLTTIPYGVQEPEVFFLDLDPLS